MSINQLKIKETRYAQGQKHEVIAENTLFIIETPEGKEVDVYYDPDDGLGLRAKDGTMTVMPKSSNGICVQVKTLTEEMEERGRSKW